MSKRSAEETRALDAPHVYAIRAVVHYIRSKPEPYNSFEKMSYYRWALDEAIILFRKNPSIPPIMILERELAKFDSWAHQGKSTSYMYQPVAAAFDDIINILQTL